MPERMSEEMSGDMSKDMSEEMSIAMPENMPEQNVRKNAEDVSEKDVRKYVGKGCQKICQTRMSEDTPEIMSIEMSEHMSDKNVKRYVRGSVNRNVRNMSDKTVKTYVRRNIRQGCQKICQKECQKECQKLCQQRMSEDMSEKNVRKNVRIGRQKRCQKICQKRMSEDMSEKDVRRYARRNVTKNVSLGDGRIHPLLCQGQRDTRTQTNVFVSPIKPIGTAVIFMVLSGSNPMVDQLFLRTIREKNRSSLVFNLEPEKKVLELGKENILVMVKAFSLGAELAIDDGSTPFSHEKKRKKFVKMTFASLMLCVSGLLAFLAGFERALPLLVVASFFVPIPAQPMNIDASTRCAWRKEEQCLQIFGCSLLNNASSSVTPVLKTVTRKRPASFMRLLLNLQIGHCT